jgi:hypothetical protein
MIFKGQTFSMDEPDKKAGLFVDRDVNLRPWEKVFWYIKNFSEFA